MYCIPSVSITSGANLIPEQQFQTQFVVSNTGHLPALDVQFSCALIGNKTMIKVLTASADTLTPIPSLKGVASRGCFTKSLVAGGPWLKVEARYKWPIFGYQQTSVAYFSVREGSTGSALVPEEPPSPEPPSLLSIGFSPQN